MAPTPLPTFDKFVVPIPRRKQPYFSDYRKGEVGEMRLLLRKMLLDSKSPSATEKFVSQIVDPNVDHFKLQNTKKRRDVLKKLISYMTMGIDLSSLYTDVVMVSQTDDPVQKKMIYLYLSNYSMNNPELAILAINTLLKDIESVDPVIRSLALRNLSAFGTNLSNEYATVSVLKRLFDPSDSVKRTAIIGSIRIYKSNCSSYGTDSKSLFDLLEDLKMALRSSNVHVMMDSMCAVSEIAEYENKIPLSTPTVIYLTNCLKNMNEWEQSSVLQLLCTYTPSTKEELFDLMNLLDPKLKHNSSALFLATAKCFLMWTKDDLFLQLEVVKRLQEPLVSLLNRTRAEVCHFLLLNVLSLTVNGHLLTENKDFSTDESSVSDYQVPFVEFYEAFFCHYDDPPYIKNLKLNILVSITTEDNAANVVQELSEYVSDYNSDIANNSVNSLGVLALKLPSQVPLVVKKLSDVYNLNLPYLSASLLNVLKTLLSVYPEFSSDLLEIVKEPSDSFFDPESKAHHISLLGDYFRDVDHTPYLLEDYVDDPLRTDLMTLELLPACIKVFLERPSEMQGGLSRLFDSVLNESENPDLVSCADYYYNLLALGPEETKKTLLTDKSDLPQPDKDSLLGQPKQFSPDPDWREHFNTLFLLEGCREFYHSENPTFFPFEHRDVPTDIFRDENIRRAAQDSSPRTLELSPSRPSDSELPGQSPTQELDLFEELQNEVKYFNLVHPSTLLSEEFQKTWFELETSFSTSMATSPKDFDVDLLQDLFSNLHMVTLASGQDEGVTKLYMYSQNVQQLMYYIEVVVSGKDEQVNVTVKVSEGNCNESELQSFAEILCDFVSRWVSQ